MTSSCSILPPDGSLPSASNGARSPTAQRHRLRSGAGAAAPRRGGTDITIGVQRRRRRGRAVRQWRALRRCAAASARPRRRRRARAGQPRWPAARARARRWPRAVDMGVPDLRSAVAAVRGPARQRRYALSSASDAHRHRRGVDRQSARSAARPAVESAPVERIGRGAAGIRVFRDGSTSASCRWSIARDIRLRVYERGVGETLACGTGACAAAVVGRQPRSARGPTSRCVCRAATLGVHWEGRASRCG